MKKVEPSFRNVIPYSLSTSALMKKSEADFFSYFEVCYTNETHIVMYHMPIYKEHAELSLGPMLWIRTALFFAHTTLPTCLICCAREIPWLYAILVWKVQVQTRIFCYSSLSVIFFLEIMMDVEFEIISSRTLRNSFRVFCKSWCTVVNWYLAW